MILSNVVSMKLSHRLITVKSVNNQYIIFSLETNLCGQLPGTANSNNCVNGDFMSVTISGPNSVAWESESIHKQGLWEGIPLSSFPWAHSPKLVALSNSLR